MTEPAYLSPTAAYRQFPYYERLSFVDSDGLQLHANSAVSKSPVLRGAGGRQATILFSDLIGLLDERLDDLVPAVLVLSDAILAVTNLQGRVFSRTRVQDIGQIEFVYGFAGLVTFRRVGSAGLDPIRMAQRAANAALQSKSPLLLHAVVPSHRVLHAIAVRFFHPAIQVSLTSDMPALPDRARSKFASMRHQSASDSDFRAIAQHLQRLHAEAAATLPLSETFADLSLPRCVRAAAARAPVAGLSVVPIRAAAVPPPLARRGATSPRHVQGGIAAQQGASPSGSQFSPVTSTAGTAYGSPMMRGNGVSAFYDDVDDIGVDGAASVAIVGSSVAIIGTSMVSGGMGSVQTRQLRGLRDATASPPLEDNGDDMGSAPLSADHPDVNADPAAQSPAVVTSSPLAGPSSTSGGPGRHLLSGILSPLSPVFGSVGRSPRQAAAAASAAAAAMAAAASGPQPPGGRPGQAGSADSLLLDLAARCLTLPPPAARNWTPVNECLKVTVGANGRIDASRLETAPVRPTVVAGGLDAVLRALDDAHSSVSHYRAAAAEMKARADNAASEAEAVRVAVDSAGELAAATAVAAKRQVDSAARETARLQERVTLLSNETTRLRADRRGARDRARRAERELVALRSLVDPSMVRRARRSLNNQIEQQPDLAAPCPSPDPILANDNFPPSDGDDRSNNEQ